MNRDVKTTNATWQIVTVTTEKRLRLRVVGSFEVTRVREF